MPPETVLPQHPKSAARPPSPASQPDWTFADTLLFTPSPDQEAALLHTFIDPYCSLRDIAEEYSTTLDALILYLSKPEVMQRLAAFETMAAFRTRLVALNHLQFVADSLRTTVEACTKEIESAPANDLSFRMQDHTRRCHETSRRACALLLRLAQFAPIPVDQRTALRPTPTSPVRTTAKPISTDLQTFAPAAPSMLSSRPPAASPPPAPTNPSRPITPAPHQSTNPSTPAQPFPDKPQAMPRQTSNNIAQLTAAAGRNASPNHPLKSKSGSQQANSMREQLLPVPAS